MSRNRFVVAGSIVFGLGLAFIACSDDPNRPPATSSGGAPTTSSGGGSNSSSGGGPTDGSTQTDGSSSSGGSSGGSSGTSSGVIETGLRGTVDNVAAEFNVTPRAVRQNNGFVIEMSGKDAAGNELRIATTGVAAIAAGDYNCTGGQGNSFSTLSYKPTGSTETWDAVANGACTLNVQSIDNQTNGVAVGTFTATVQKGGAPDKVITNGQFRLTLD